MRLIDADVLKLVPTFNGEYDHENANEHFIYGIETVMEYIDKMPTIDPESLRPHGEWEHTNSLGDYFCEV